MESKNMMNNSTRSNDRLTCLALLVSLITLLSCFGVKADSGQKSNQQEVLSLTTGQPDSHAAVVTTVIGGTVRSATTGLPMTNVLVRMGTVSNYTTAQGSYILRNVPVGTNQLTAAKSGYVFFSTSRVLVSPTNTFHFAMSPLIISGSSMRLVLSWGANPSDLDSHLTVPAISGVTNHVWFSNKGSLSAPPYARLDVDDTTSYGPETITITNFVTGTYNYYVHRWAGAGTIAGSGATVRVYTGAGLLRTIVAPATGTGDYWHVLQVNGATRVVTIINRIQSTVPRTTQTTVLGGIVRHATTGQVLSNVLVSASGQSTYTTAQGSFVLRNLPVGTVQLSASKFGFVNFSTSRTLVAGTNSYHFAMSPSITSASTMRMVLTWGANPSDLDSHLITPTVGAFPYHVYFASPGNLLSPPYASLDTDDTTSYGPETITITNFSAGVYNYYVHRWSGSGTIAGSGATVRVYTGAGLAHTFVAPASGVGDYWHVLQINGSTRAVTFVNQIRTTPPTNTVSGTSVLTGVVRHATTGLVLSNVLVSASGQSTYTTAQGAFTLRNLPTGTVTVNGTRSGFVVFSTQRTLVTGTNVYHFAMSPSITSGTTMRLVLTWGANPSDLDSHLRTPSIGGTNFHVYFGWPGTLFTQPFASLDTDDTTSYGPETITITNFTAGTYKYFVHRWSGSGGIAGSGATVRVYTGAGLIRTIVAPSTGTGDYWNVLRIDGATRALTVVNTVNSSETLNAAAEANEPMEFIFQNQNGQLGTWSLQREQLLPGALLNDGASLGLGWRLAGATDFNDEKTKDLVFQHGDGHSAAWLMNGTIPANAMYLRDGVAMPASSRMVGTADFNKDAKADVLWQNADGSLETWLMDGTTFVSSRELSHTIDSQWRAVAAANFDSNHHPDLLFQNDNGSLALWLMNGVNRTGIVQINGGASAGDGWSAVAAADVNGDDSNDIIFQNSEGAVMAWLMEGSNFIRSMALPSSATGGWTLRGVK
jgi:uncharacterized protein YfaP (DUF2135 family)